MTTTAELKRREPPGSRWSIYALLVRRPVASVPRVDLRLSASILEWHPLPAGVPIHITYPNGAL
eukprot:scaffold37532_cov33-Tisochrysis_lutea.AAC.5